MTCKEQSNYMRFVTSQQIPNEESRVLVGDLPEGITQNEIHIHFQRKKNRGGEIKEVKLLSESEALVVFKDPKGMFHVILFPVLNFLDVLRHNYDVSIYIPALFICLFLPYCNEF